MAVGWASARGGGGQCTYRHLPLDGADLVHGLASRAHIQYHQGLVEVKAVGDKEGRACPWHTRHGSVMGHGVLLLADHKEVSKETTPNTQQVYRVLVWT